MKYRDFVLSRLHKTENLNPLVHGALGLAGEAGEVVEVVKKHLCYGQKLDYVHLKEELGDTLFYLELVMHLAGFTRKEVEEANVAKLKKRYPREL